MDVVSTVRRRAGRLSADAEELRRATRQWAEDKLRPEVARMDRAACFPGTLVDELFDLGLMGIQIPERHGGRGCPFSSSVLVIEEIARVDPSVAVCVDVQNVLVVNALLRWGSDAQQAQHLPRLARNVVGAYSLTEPDAGSDAFALRSHARRDTGGYVLSGRKIWTTNAREAGLFLVFATVDPERGPHGITAFLVPRDAAGLSVGPDEDKLGIRASSACELLLDDVRVTPADRLGEEGDGYDIAVDTLNLGRIGIGAQMVGLATGAVDAAAAYAKQRRQFGQPIAGFQGVQLPLAQIATETEAAGLLVDDAARTADTEPFSTEIMARAAMAKLFAAQVAERAASRAVQTFGGNGYSTGYPVEKLYRDALIGQLYEGTSNVLLRGIAGHVLAAAPTSAAMIRNDN